MHPVVLLSCGYLYLENKSQFKALTQDLKSLHFSKSSIFGWVTVLYSETQASRAVTDHITMESLYSEMTYTGSMILFRKVCDSSTSLSQDSSSDKQQIFEFVAQWSISVAAKVTWRIKNDNLLENGASRTKAVMIM
jgi:hypothetical protein